MLDEAAQQEAAMTTLINNKAELLLDTVMQDNMELQNGCCDALRVSGVGGHYLICWLRLQAFIMADPGTHRTHCNIPAGDWTTAAADSGSK